MVLIIAMAMVPFMALQPQTSVRTIIRYRKEEKHQTMRAVS